MGETSTKPTTEAPQAAPPAQPPALIKPREAWSAFETEIIARAEEIGTQLPPNVSRDKFIGASLAAVKATPTILLATPRSLMSALIKAAQDGLLPDGREGIITTYLTTVKEAGKPDRKEYVAHWNPMFYGIRKRAREIDGIIIDAQVVLAIDDFDFELGDAPFIKHKPKARAEAVDASAGIAAYAIFRAADQTILHREVMWKPEIFATMNQSRVKESLMYTTFWTEGWRKIVGRRGSKSVPVSPQLERLIQRNDEEYVFDRPPAISGPAAPAIPDPGPKAPAIPDPTENPPRDPENADAVELHGDALLDQLHEWLETAKSEDLIEEVWSDLDIESEFSADRDRMGKAIDMKAAAVARLTRKTAEDVDGFSPTGRRIVEALFGEEVTDAEIDSLFPGARAP
jgi:recombination protein RecT